MNPYVILAAVAVWIVTGLGGVWWGESIGASKCAAAQLKPQVAATQAAVTKADNQLKNGQLALGAVTAANVAQAEVTATKEIVTKTVIKYVKAKPELAKCGLDADGLRIWNAANAGTDPTN